MKLPVILLSIGDYRETKKLFSMGIDGILTIPIFTRAQEAQEFIKRAEEFTKKQLVTQVCDNKAHLHSIFVTIGSLYGVVSVVVNPGSDSELTVDIDEFIEQIDH